MAIKNIIFDFGGVILDIDYLKTKEAFQTLGLSQEQLVYTQKNQSDWFSRIETGQISEQRFLNGLLEFLPPNTKTNVVVEAWNALLGNYKSERLLFLLETKTKYRSFLLSNTNVIHERWFTQKLRKEYGTQLSDYFEKVYYSHELGMRKPNKEIFEFVLQDNKLLPNETIFIDDSIQHIETAKQLGIQTLHLKQNQEVYLELPLLLAKLNK
jgi:putative hydrolase of the HAD superfamily